MLAIIGNMFINLDSIDYVEQDHDGLLIRMGVIDKYISSTEEEYAMFLAVLAAYARKE